MKYLLVFLSFCLTSFSLFADQVYDEIAQDLNKAGGVYFAYPVTKSNNTLPPPDYKPFYISHIGRHGSRYLLKESDYTNPLKTLEHAHARKSLTVFGEGVYKELKKLYDSVQYRAGDLSELGVTQHKEIARRMFNAYPNVFEGENLVVAHSTMVMRCAMSMAAFTESLKELNPKLRIVRDPSEKNVRYMNSQNESMSNYNDANGFWQKEYREYRTTNTPFQSFIPRIFSDSIFVHENVNAVNFTCQMYNVSVGMQDINVKAKFDNLFTAKELFELWKIYNFRMYAHYSNYSHSNGVVLKSCIPLLKDIIERAEYAINNHFTGAHLRFGHDINIIPLAGLMGLEGCNNPVNTPDEVYKIFQDYKISPMASNIQLIFFKNELNDVIVKFMLNEEEIALRFKTDTFPFYKWSDVRAYFENIISEGKL